MDREDRIREQAEARFPGYQVTSMTSGFRDVPSVPPPIGECGIS